MKINKEINLVELASEMASIMLDNLAEQNGYKLESLFTIDEDDKENTIYTDEAQDLFNEYYDDIYELLEQKGFKHKQ